MLVKALLREENAELKAKIEGLQKDIDSLVVGMSYRHHQLEKEIVELKAQLNEHPPDKVFS